MAALAACALLAAVGFLRWPRSAPPGGRTAAFAAPVLFLALLVGAEASGARVWIVGRTDAALLPLALLAVAAGLASIPRRAGLAAGLVLLALAAPALREHYALDHRSQERLLAASILSEAGPGDVVLVTGVWGPALRYYFHREASAPALRSFPPGFETRPVNAGWEAELEGRDPRDVGRQLAAGLRAGGGRVWLVLDDRPEWRPMAEAMGEGFAAAGEFRAPAPLPVTVIRFEPRPAPPAS